MVRNLILQLKAHKVPVERVASHPLHNLIIGEMVVHLQEQHQKHRSRREPGPARSALPVISRELFVRPGKIKAPPYPQKLMIRRQQRLPQHLVKTSLPAFALQHRSTSVENLTEIV